MKSATLRRAALAALTGLVCPAIGCDSADDGEGTFRITIYGEEFIEEGIPADVFSDGWSLEFSRFLVAVHDIEADGVQVEGSYVYDLTVSSGGDGHELTSLPMPAGTVQRVGYRIGPASAGAQTNGDPADATAMADRELSLWVTGTATRGEESIEIDWGLDRDTLYHDCETDQTLADGGTATSQITVHADHLFYDDLDSSTPNTSFDLLASADADADGQVTPEEVAAVDISAESRYQVGSRDITDLWSFIAQQSTTVGHIDGEGHCEFTEQ